MSPESPTGPTAEPVEISAEVFAMLAEVSTATLQTQLFNRGLRRTVLDGVRPIVPERSRFVGEAFTLRYIPAREDLDVVEAFKNPNHPQRLAIESVPPGHVLIVDSRQDGGAASAGEILLTRLGVRGVVGFVTDGSVRDSHKMAETGVAVFVKSVTPTTNLVLHHAVDMQIPIGCGGVAVFPGDILVGDPEGVVVIPRHLTAQVASDAAAQEDLESFLLDRVRSGAQLPGTYPPDTETRAEYNQHRGADRG